MVMEISYSEMELIVNNMTHIPIDKDKAFMADEGVRFRENTAKQLRNAWWQKKVLEVEESTLPDYERPTKLIIRAKGTRNFWRTITNFTKQFIP